MSVASGDLQATFAATLVDEWVRAGVADAVVCPGSRSTPLATALAGRPELHVHVRLDERSAGFFAIGLAGGRDRPVVICTTSGTAAAELHPSVVEAHHHGVPLLVCTADRPPELQQVGAAQTIDQHSLFGPAVRWHCAPGVPDRAGVASWRSLAARMLLEATAGPSGPGPVHANLAFREPLIGTPGRIPQGRRDGSPWHVARRGDTVSPRLARELAVRAGTRGLIVVGAGAGDPALVLSLAEHLRWPLLADPRSGCRIEHAGVVGAADAVLRAPSSLGSLRPEMVLQLGAPWTSSVVAGFLSASARRGTEVWAVDPWWRWRDPDRLLATTVCADPCTLASAVVGVLEGGVGATESAWQARWRRAENAAQRAIDEALGTGPEESAARSAPLNEPLVARQLLGWLDARARVVVSSSMPVRDVECFAPKLAAPPRVWVNRGANGIDGVTSTALGFAASGSGAVVGLLGDLGFLHDVSALVHPLQGAGGGSPCALVVVDNGGGGIFSFLPQARVTEACRFEQLFGTPMAPPLAQVARGLGAEVVIAATVGELEDAVSEGLARWARAAGALQVVRAVVPGRAQNVAIHDRVHSKVVAAVEEVLDSC